MHRWRPHEVAGKDPLQGVDGSAMAGVILGQRRQHSEPGDHGCQEILDGEREDEEPSTSAGEPIALTPDITAESLQQYLKDIGEVRLLTAQEEVDLAKRIERERLSEIS